MNLSHPIESVIPSAHGPVLEVLATTAAPLTGRQVAGLVEGRLSPRRVADVLGELASAGLVSMTQAGSAHQYLLNREHLAAEAVLALAGLRTALVEAMANDAGSWEVPPVAVWLYGSVSRGEAGEDSDVDLCIIRPDAVDEDDRAWTTQVEQLRDRVLAWSGNNAEVLEYSPSALAALDAADDPIITSLRTDGRALFGPRPAQLLRSAGGGDGR
jgi:Nucleotidyltransferase domain